MPNGKDTRFIGTQVDKEFHRRVKIKCAEMDLSVGEAIVNGLCLLLSLEEVCEDDTIKTATGS